MKRATLGLPMKNGLNRPLATVRCRYLLTRRVTAAGIQHDLTAREFVLLELFLRHSGQVVSREQSLPTVWGLGHAPAGNVVDVYSRYRRQKLGNDLIHTGRGMGYRLG